MVEINKVSLIIPCYNVAENKLGRMMNSILHQSYSKIEIILVNDGSTDDTLTRLYKWQESFIERGYECLVFSKPNGGAASAINIGLKHFTGEYVCFPDADDALNSEYVSKMASFLTTHSDSGWVRSNSLIINEEKNTERVMQETLIKDRYFEEMLVTDFNVVIWTIMVRRTYLIKCIPSLFLFENRGTQEWQLLLPLTYHSRFSQIEDVLYTHYIYSDSYIHSIVNDNSFWVFINQQFEVCIETLRQMDMTTEDFLRAVDLVEFCRIRQIIGYFGFESLDNEKRNFCVNKIALLLLKHCNISLNIKQASTYLKFMYYFMYLRGYFLGEKMIRL